MRAAYDVRRVRVTLLELPARWNAVDRALAEVEVALAGCTSDLVLLPEASLTGYLSPDGDADLTRFAEPIEGPTSRACAALAATHAVHLVAPLILREGDALFNAMVCHAPDGTRPFIYRKRHPWIPEEWATPGREPLPVVEIAGRILTISRLRINDLSLVDVVVAVGSHCRVKTNKLTSWLITRLRRSPTFVSMKHWNAFTSRT